MSFVGPRPERPQFVDQLKREIRYYSVRHSVKPGLTGWAQLRYPYGPSVRDAEEKLKFDLFYVQNHELLLDLMILLHTVKVMMFSRGSREVAQAVRHPGADTERLRDAAHQPRAPPVGH